jgi:hypothetical protein
VSRCFGACWPGAGRVVSRTTARAGASGRYFARVLGRLGISLEGAGGATVAE